MPIKPSATERGAYEAMRKNPNYGRDALEAIINETPELKEALLKAGLVVEVKEVKYND